VGATGEAKKAEIASSSGVSALDDTAVSAVRNWRFKPAQRAGVAVDFTIVVPVRFELE
jgi:protein TonB